MTSEIFHVEIGHGRKGHSQALIVFEALYTVGAMHNAPINVFPQRRGGGDTLGIRLPKQSLPSGI